MGDWRQVAPGAAHGHVPGAAPAPGAENRGAMAETRKRRARNPEATREAILVAAQTMLAKDGPEALSLSKVAQLAGVNRGTAYQHFETREKLIAATIEWVADQIFEAVFGQAAAKGERRLDEPDMLDVTDRLGHYAMDNPELCRIWLLQLLASPNPSQDRFWREYSGSLGRFAESERARPGIDVEVFSLVSLAGYFLWPIWARAHSRNDDERDRLAQRFNREMLRLSLYGTLDPAKHPETLQTISRPLGKGGEGDAPARQAKLR